MEQTPSVSAGLRTRPTQGCPTIRKPTQQEEAVGHTQGHKDSRREGGVKGGFLEEESRTSLKSTGSGWSTQE